MAGNGLATALRAAREMRDLESRAMRSADRAASLLRGAAAREVLTGKLSLDVFKLTDERLVPALSRAMAVAHLVGRRRSRLAAQQAGVTVSALSLSRYDGSIALADVWRDTKRVLRKTMDLNVGDLQQRYSRLAVKTLRDAARDIDLKLRDTITGIGSQKKLRQQALALLGDALDAAGISADSSAKLQTIFRTALYQAAAIGRWEEDQTQDDLWGYRYVTMSDDRVRAEHQLMDGVTLPRDDMFWAMYTPPNGWNCRCQLQPLYTERKERRVATRLLPRLEPEFDGGPELWSDDLEIGLAWITSLSHDGKSYGCAMLMLSPRDATAVRVLGKRIALKDLHENGCEDEPHVTVLYGLKDDSDDPDVVREVLSLAWDPDQPREERGSAEGGQWASRFKVNDRVMWNTNPGTVVAIRGNDRQVKLDANGHTLWRASSELVEYTSEEFVRLRKAALEKIVGEELGEEPEEAKEGAWGKASVIDTMGAWYSGGQSIVNERELAGLPVRESDEMLNKLPKYRGTVHRGMALTNDGLKEFNERYATGKIVTQRTSSAGSAEESIAEGFTWNDVIEGASNRVMMHYKTSDEADARKHNKAEKEVILRRGKHHKVLSHKQAGDLLHVYLEEAKDVPLEFSHGADPITAKLGRVSLFTSDEYDVLKVDVISSDLRRMNKLLRDKLEHITTHKDYKPHITIAYLKPGRGAEYAREMRDELQGRKIELKRVKYSTADEEKSSWQLAFDEDKHPREPAGTSDGGEFVDVKGRNVTFLGHNDIRAVTGEMLTDVSNDELANVVADLSGALQEDATSVRIEVDAKLGLIYVKVDHPKYTSKRTIDFHERTITNDSIEVHTTGTGLGTRILADQVATAAAHGFKYLRTHAAGDHSSSEYNGYYTWPRLGYDAVVDRSGSFSSDVLAYAEKHGLKKISDFIKVRSHREWWQRNGEDTDVYFDLHEGSASRQVLDRYVARKKAKATALAWDESKHPRDPAGTSEGGEFATKLEATKRDAAGKLRLANGKALPEHLASVRVPPAWTDVQVSLDPDSRLLVKGKDAKGRTQSVYSAQHWEKQAELKFALVKELLGKMDSIVAENKARMHDNDAAVVTALIQHTGIRPGSDDDTGAKVQAYGATTLQGKHVVKTANGIALRFVGKKGVSLDIPVTDRELARELLQRKSAAGPKGKLFTTDDGELRDYVKTLNGGGFKPKDFRTARGTSLARDLVKNSPTPRDEKSYKKAVKQVAIEVSRALGNTPTVALQSYIDPHVFKKWRDSAAVELAWEEKLHPREEAGTSEGGQWASTASRQKARVKLSKIDRDTLRSWTGKVRNNRLTIPLAVAMITYAEEYNDPTDESVQWNKTLDKMPKYEGIVYRGFDVMDSDHDEGRSSSYVESLKKGGVIELKHSTSTSKDSSVADNYGDVGFRFKTRSGADVSHVELVQNREVVLRKGTKYRVSKISKLSSGKKIFDLEEV